MLRELMSFPHAHATTSPREFRRAGAGEVRRASADSDPTVACRARAREMSAPRPARARAPGSRCRAASLPPAHAAIDEQPGPHDEARLVRRQEERRGRDVLGPSEFARQLALADRLEALLAARIR